MQLTYLPLLSGWMIFTLAVMLVALLAHGSLVLMKKRVPGAWVIRLAIIRLVAIVVLVLCLMRPILSYTSEDERRPDLLVMIDTSESMGGIDGGAARLGKAVDDFEDSGLRASLAEQFDIHYFAYDEDARPIDAGDVSGLAAAGGATRAGRSMQTAWSHYRQQVQDNDGTAQSAPQLLMISDGIDASLAEAGRLAQRVGAPVYTFSPQANVGSDASPEVALANVQGPRRVMLGGEARFRVNIRQTQAAGVPLVVSLLLDGSPVVTRKVTMQPNEPERQIELAHRPSRAGVQAYTIAVDTEEIGVGVTAGPTQELTVQVVGRKNKALFLEDAWRWEFRFLRRIFEADPNYAFTAFLSRGPGIYMQFIEPDSPVKLGGFPQSKRELEWFDLIILGDVNPRTWPAALPGALNDLVVNQGKSLIVIAGPGLMRLAENPELAQLLPVELTPKSAMPIQGPVKVRITSEGRDSSMFFASTSEGTVSFDSLPDMDQVYAPLRKKPAATIIMDTPDHANDFGPVIVLAEHTVGKGRVLYVGTDTLWRWQMLSVADAMGNTPYTQFWQQALRAMTPNRLVDGAVTLWLQPDRSQYETGQTVQLTAEVESPQPVNASQLELFVRLPSGRDVPLSLTPNPADPTRYTGAFEAAEPGQYRLEAELKKDGRTLATVTSAVDAIPPAPESPSSPADVAALHRLAASTGGKYVDPGNRDTWPRAEQQDVVMVAKHHTIDLWSNFSLVLLLVGVLGFDWLVRLLRGFV